MPVRSGARHTVATRLPMRDPVSPLRSSTPPHSPLSLSMLGFFIIVCGEHGALKDGAAQNDFVDAIPRLDGLHRVGVEQQQIGDFASGYRSVVLVDVELPGRIEGRGVED